MERNFDNFIVILWMLHVMGETTTCVSPLELGFGELKHDYILKHDCDFGFELVILEGRRGKRFFFEVG